MEIKVKNGKVTFNGNVLGLISELKENSSFVELWNKAESSFEEENSTLDLEASCVIGFLNYAMECEYKPTKQQVTDWLITRLG